MSADGYVDLVLASDGDSPFPRFIEIEDETGASIRMGEYLTRPDGSTVIRIPTTEED